MSLSILEKVATHIAEISGINDWYEYYFSPIAGGETPSSAINNKFFRYTDADTNGNTPFFMFRVSGGGASSSLLQQTDVTIMLVHNPTEVVTGNDLMWRIIRLFRTDATQDGIVRFDPQGAVIGPMYMENGRPVWQLVVSVYTEDQ